MLRPGPWLWTLLALELNRGGPLWVRLLLDALKAGSTVRVEVTLALVTFTRRGPAERGEGGAKMKMVAASGGTL